MAGYAKSPLEKYGTATSYTCKMYIVHNSEYEKLGMLYAMTHPPCLRLLDGWCGHVQEEQEPN